MADPIALPDIVITSITSPPPHCPAIEYDKDNVRRGYYSTLPTVHCTDGAPQQSPPLVFRGRGHARFHVVLALAAHAGPDVTLHARLFGARTVLSDNAAVRVTRAAATTAAFDLDLLPPVLNGAYRDLPWKFGSNAPDESNLVRFNLSRLNGTVVASCTFNLELYVVHESLPLFMYKDGLPLALLRSPSFIPVWLGGLDVLGPTYRDDPDRPLDSDDFSAFVVKFLFRDHRLTYNCHGGAVKYVNSTHLSKMLYLDLFLSDMAGLESRPQDVTKYKVNCSDLAHLTVSLCSLGVDFSKLKIVSMGCFGFINTARLIGERIATNNPFYANLARAQPPGHKGPLYIANNEQTMAGFRSSFQSHTFAAVEKTIAGETAKYILDSTCGPNTGTVKDVDYPNAAIDPVQYWVDIIAAMPEEKRKLLKKAQEPPKRGTAGDMAVSGLPLVLAPAVGRFAQSAAGGGGRGAADNLNMHTVPLLSKMTELFKDKAGLHELLAPQMSYSATDDTKEVEGPYPRPRVWSRYAAPCISWTLQYRGHKNEVPAVIMIYIYTYSAYRFTAKHGEAGKIDEVVEQDRLQVAFDDQVTRYGLKALGPVTARMAIVDGLGTNVFADDKADALAVVVSQRQDLKVVEYVSLRVKAALKTLHAGAAEAKVFHEPRLRLPLLLPPRSRVGSTIQIVLQAEYHDEGHEWYGYVVSTDNGNLFLTAANVDKSTPATRNNVILDFMVRAAVGASDVINVQLFDNFLRCTQSHSLNISLY